MKANLHTSDESAVKLLPLDAPELFFRKRKRVVERQHTGPAGRAGSCSPLPTAGQSDSQEHDPQQLLVSQEPTAPWKMN